MVPLESETQRDIMLAAPALGCRLLRNMVGRFEDLTGRWVAFGVGGPGGADLLGWTDVEGDAIFTAIEVKRRPRKATAEQEAFLAAVNAAGGIGALCYTVQDFQDAIHAYKNARASRLRIQWGGPSGVS